MKGVFNAVKKAVSILEYIVKNVDRTHFYTALRVCTTCTICEICLQCPQRNHSSTQIGKGKFCLNIILQNIVHVQRFIMLYIYRPCLRGRILYTTLVAFSLPDFEGGFELCCARRLSLPPPLLPDFCPPLEASPLARG